MAVSTETCNQPANDCYGVANSRIPLEDILIDDGSGTENSFRYHLNRAAAAAAESDRLAEELVQAGLAMDQRAETALETIEEQCGATINVDPFLAPGAEAGVRSVAEVVTGPCVDGACVTPGYSCVAGSCVLDLGARPTSAPDDDYNTEVLSQCLGLGAEDEIVPRVGLGSSRICVVVDPAAPNVLCRPDLTGGEECPQVIRRDENCPEGPGWTTIEGEDLLRLIPARDVGGILLGSHAEGDFSSVCDDLRTVRSTGDEAALQRIVESDFFGYGNVSYWARRVGWRANPNDYSEFTLDGATWYATGQPFVEWAREDGDGVLEPGERPAGPSPTWPCTGAHLRPDVCGVGETGLFCGTPTDCTDRIQRAGWNDRMARAAITLGMAAEYGLNVVLPVEYGGVPVSPGSLDGRSFVHDESGRTWVVAASGIIGGDDRRSGVYAFPPAAEPPAVVWTTGSGSGLANVVFVNLGAGLTETSEVYSEALWDGMSSGTPPGLRSPYSAGPFRRVLEGFGSAGIPGDDPWLGEHRDQLTRYWSDPFDNVRVGGSLGVSVNLARIAPETMRRTEILDAMELVCEAAMHVNVSTTCDPAHPPVVTSRENLPELRAYLSCIANRLESMGDRVVLQDVPRGVVALVRNEASIIRPDEGEYGRNSISLRDNLRLIASIPRSIAQQLRDVSTALELLELALSEIDARQEIGDLQTAMSTIDQAVACVSAASSVQLGAISTCALAAAHIAIGLRINDLEGAILDSTRQQQLLQFRSQYEAAQERLAQLAEQLAAASEQANASLSALRSGRRQARRNLGYALFLSSDEAGRHYAVNTVMRRRYNTLRVRYERAHRSAVQMAEIARIALEQRLGLSLADVDRTDLTLVDNPRNWWNSACTSSGVDYSAIRGVDDIDGDNYAGAFVGDYVRNLEQFFDTYRIDFPYVDGRDTVVLSMRNDIATSSEACASTAWNLLGASNDLVARHEFLSDGRVVDEGDTSDSEAVPLAWTDEGCAEGGEGILDNCVSVSPISDGPAVPDTAGRTPPAPFRVIFAAEAIGSAPPPMTFTLAANWGQDLEVRPGLYRLSWYGRVSEASAVSAQRVDLASVDAGTLTSHAASATPLPGPSGWLRYVRYFEVPRTGTVRVRVRADQSLTSIVEHSIDVAGVQLESVSDRLTVAATSISEADITTNPRVYWPRDFIATTSRGTALFASCEDIDGSTFRRRHWAYQCDARLCEAGVDRCRPDEVGEWLCYWESPPVNLSPEQFSPGGLFERAGLARGSFNYRIDDVALNFVGTGSRVCSDPARASSCYSSGYIQYSIQHDGPFPVINRSGDAHYEAPIFSARIEQARGLAAERVITNPISPADRALLDEYRRTEFRGRPLSGELRVRIWDTGDVNFGGIEDVQVVLNYRYFTRAGDDRP
jgi:hypothetical protein